MLLFKLALAFFGLVGFGVLSAPTKSTSSRSSGSGADSDKPGPRENGNQRNIGDFVGVRIKDIEEPSKENKKVDIHPGVILEGPHPETGLYRVATISNKHPHNPPQLPIENFHHPDSNIYGNIALSPPREVQASAQLKKWKDKKTGVIERPMSKEDLARLKQAMAPHMDWAAPKHPPTPVAQPVVSPDKAKQSTKGSRSPHANAHASSSRNPGPPHNQLSHLSHTGARPPTNPSVVHPNGPHQVAYRSSVHPLPIRPYNAAQHSSNISPLAVNHPPTANRPFYPSDNRHPTLRPRPAGLNSALPPTTHSGSYPLAAFRTGGRPSTAPGGHSVGHSIPSPYGNRYPRVAEGSRPPSHGPIARSPSPNRSRPKGPKGRNPASGSHGDHWRKPPPMRR